MENNKRVLVVDDDISSCDIIAEFLKKRGFKPLTASNGIMALEQMKQTPVDAVLTDLRMPDMDGISFYNQILENDMSEIPVIFMTAYGTIPEIVSIMKKGAIDTLAKPINYENLEIILNRVIKYKRMAEELEKLKEEKNTQNFSELIGKSKKMQKIFNLIKTVSGTDVTVLIEGESGTGKDLVASAIHKNSIRKNGEFIAINCSAIPRDLIEAQLFGYKKGSFSGAINDFKGMFLMAHGGTIFLDEIALLETNLQGKLLRVIEEKMVRPIGETNMKKTDIRIIAASNTPILDAVNNSSFREDLYYRLNVFSIKMPPLRERKEDIPLLVKHFMDQFKIEQPIQPEAMEKLINHNWPGNVRELKNVLERAGIIAGNKAIDKKHIITNSLKSDAAINGKLTISPTLTDLPNESFPINTFQQNILKIVLQKFNQNQSASARYLGISRKILQTMMKNSGLL